MAKKKNVEKDNQEDFKQIYENETKRDDDKEEREQASKEIVDIPIPVGTKFSDLYEVISSEQSKGGMGKAILCKSIQDNKYYVLKKAQLKETEISEAFKKEIEFTLKLDKHPNIVYTQTAIKEEDTFYMVMELVGKQQKHPLKEDWWFAKTLEDKINNNEIDLETAFTWAIEFCRGMQYLNSVGLESHQDIKPKNIFVTEDNHIKIADFGLASFEGVFYSGGTKKYFSPEHGRKDLKCDIRSDIYSFGIVMYEMFNSTILKKSTKNTGKEVCELIEDKECKYCSEIIKKCLQENPTDRYQTFVELEEDIAKESKKYFGENFEIENKQMTANDYFSKAKGSELIENYEQAIELYTKAININPRYIEAYYNRGGIKRRIMKQYNFAIEDYNKVIEIDSKKAKAYNNITYCYLFTNQTLKAKESIDKALKIEPNNSNYIDTLGDVYKNINECNKAIDQYNKAIDIDPKRALYYAKRGMSYYNLNENEKALKDFNTAIELNTKNLSFSDEYAIYNKRALVKERLKQYKEAIEDYDKAIMKIQPELSEKYSITNIIKIKNTISMYYLNRGKLYYRLNENKKALKDFDIAIIFNLKDDIAYNRRAWVKERLKQYKEAIEDYNEAIKINPKESYYYSNRGESYYYLNENDKALKDFDKAIELNPKNDRAYWKRAWVKERLKQYKEAIEDYNEAIKINSKVAYYYSNRGNRYYLLNENKKALKDFDVAIQLSQDNYSHYYNMRALVKNRLKQYKEAIEDYNEAIKIKPKESIFYSNRGEAYYNLNENEKALKDFNKAIELNPKKDSAYYKISNIKLDLKQYEDSIVYCDEAIKLNPQNMKYYNRRGVTKIYLKDYKGALKDHLQQFKLGDRSSTVYNNIGKAYFGLKEYEKAQTYYNKAIKINPNSARYHFNRGLLYFTMKQYQKAFDDYSNAKKLYEETMKNNKLFGLELTQYEELLKEYEKTKKFIKEHQKG